MSKHVKVKLEGLPAQDAWDEGFEYAMTQLCAVLGINPQDVVWEAATETLEGDARSVIRNALRVKYGEDWKP